VTNSQIPPEQLREMYVGATLRQRYRTASQRIDHPELGPSVLVNAVSALEGFSRAVAVRALVANGAVLKAAYGRLRNTGAVDLITLHVCPALGLPPAEAFDARAWEQIPEAVHFRNLLIHEATFLHGGTCKRLIAASRHCLERLAELTVPPNHELLPTRFEHSLWWFAREVDGTGTV
jgi:hypothetical protein